MGIAAEDFPPPENGYYPSTSKSINDTVPVVVVLEKRKKELCAGEIGAFFENFRPLYHLAKSQKKRQLHLVFRAVAYLVNCRRNLDPLSKSSPLKVFPLNLFLS